MADEKTVIVPPGSAPVPPTLPVLVTDEVVVFPHMVVPLAVARESDMEAMDQALVKYKMVVAVARRPEAQEKAAELAAEDIYPMGSAAMVLKMVKVPDGTRRALLQGTARLRILRMLQRKPYFLAQVETVQEQEERDVEMEALIHNARTLFQRLVNLSPFLPEEMFVQAINIDDGGKLADFIVSNLQVDTSQRQGVLENLDAKQRLKQVVGLLNNELEVLELGQKIQSEAQSQMEKTQRDYILRQQLDAIRRELGEEERGSETEDLRAAIEAAQMPPQAHEQATKELERLEKMPTAAAEYTVARTYLDWLVRLPWNVQTKDVLEIGKAQEILDEDHYDLDKVKDRILEYLAVLELKPDIKGPILCFVGPPGTGKTSLGMSIARGLGRKFVKISLGGMRDEAEIRGHRRTYIGALPGQIIQSIARAGTRNPVFMMDEIDKVGMDFRGDPSAALLEVLDPEQNFAFRDHYLDVDFDLSRVIFITTANVLDPVPPALRDRMEVLELPGYTLNEKLAIARKYLIPRQLKGHGLARKHLQFGTPALRAIIQEYTREAGLRNLEREIATICRKRARRYLEGERGRVQIRPEGLYEYLGPRRFFDEIIERHRQPGVAAGLAWTPAGGDILFVEAAVTRGNRTLTLTGHLGEVMKESAQAALTCIRARAAELGFDASLLDQSDIHIHVPAGAIPKDGPSAGITMATALASALTKRPVRHNLAMTGEITLHGRVLPIGGVKEKVLAAARAGVKTVILPRRNEVDVPEIPEDVRKKLRLLFVDRIDEVLDAALKKP